MNMYGFDDTAAKVAADRNGGVYIETDRNVSLQTHPHHSDTRFNSERTVFGNLNASNVLFYNYDDRLEREGDKHKRGVAAATAAGHPVRSVNWYETYLSAWHDAPCELLHVLAVLNRSNGHHVAAFGYVVGEKTSESK